MSIYEQIQTCNDVLDIRGDQLDPDSARYVTDPRERAEIRRYLEAVIRQREALRARARRKH